MKQDVVDALAKIRKYEYGLRPIFCKHPECPNELCMFNQMYITIKDLDKDILYADLKCEKYLDT